VQAELSPLKVRARVDNLGALATAGGGRTNLYFPHGFNLDHGADFATCVASIPVNVPIDAHSG
jgi:hypothetical protein